MCLDSDSELIWESMSYGADEAANARPLIEQEEAVHGTTSKACRLILSATTRVLKSLSDDETGPQLTVYVPKGQQPRHPSCFNWMILRSTRRATN
ncbi:MAG: hypothetical protein IPJ07_23585 [Acidobacteria bacterium]|nr:hypothetical protein [Acidobacteriota bacterium]